MPLKIMIETLQPAFLEDFSKNPRTPCRLFLSASTLEEPATVRHAVAESPEAAWQDAAEKLCAAVGDAAAILRADWVTESEQMTWESFHKHISTVRRNRFRKGLALDTGYAIAFTEQELNANRMLYCVGDNDPKTWKCTFRKDRSDEYCEQRFRRKCPEPSSSSIVEVFHTEGVFVCDGDMPQAITASGLHAGYRRIPRWTGGLITQIVQKAAMYLVRQCLTSGKFIYGHYPCSGNVYPSYNILRHFGTVYAMLEAYASFGLMGNPALGQATSRALDFGLRNHCLFRPLPNGTEAAYIHEQGEICLGGNGIALLALAKHATVMRTKRHLPLMQALARGILSLQQENGTFVHVLHAEDFSLKERFSVSFYDGEAALGLLRLYAITREEALLESVKRLFESFLATDYWKYGDHWVAYAVSELVMRVPKREYFAFGLRNLMTTMTSLDYADNFHPAQLEHIMAAEAMMRCMKAIPEMAGLLEETGFDPSKFEKGMARRAALTLNCFVWPETAMYFCHPEQALHGFHDRTMAFRIRIDDVQHSISGLLAYGAYLQRTGHDPD